MKKLSDILLETREEKGISLDKVEQDTKIKKEFLEAIEKGDYIKLPSESHAMGFVKNYARYLGLPLASTVPLFRREYSARHAQHIVPNFRKTQHKFNRQFLSAKVFLAAAVFLIVGIYIFLQYSSLIFPPRLNITSPHPNEEISGNVVNVLGQTDPYATVTVDGEDVYVNLQGTFRKSIYMFSGDSKVDVVAKNRFGKTSEKVVNVKIK